MIKANFILCEKIDPNDLIISIPTTPAKGDLVYIDETIYRVSNLCWDFSTKKKNMKY